jgi:N-methylhydantoinase A
VRVPVDDHLDSDSVVAAFHDAHEQLYGYCFRDRPQQQVEWVNLRVTGIGPIRRPTLPTLDDGPPAHSTVRRVCFGNEYADTPVYWRDDLRPGATVEGPAVVDEYGSTVPLHPGFTAIVDRFGNLVVTPLDGGRARRTDS